MKHARATEFAIDLQSDESELRLVIQDNGLGIAQNQVGVPQSYGIASMQHRVTALGGSMRIERAAGGRGTIVEVKVPRDRARQIKAAESAETVQKL